MFVESTIYFLGIIVNVNFYNNFLRIIMKRLKLKYNKTISDKRDKLKNKLSYYLIKGLTLEEAILLSGTSKEAVNRLRDDEDFDEFLQLCLAKNKEEHLDIIRECALNGQVNVSQWYLERKYPEEFGKRDIIKHEFTLKIQTLQKVLVGILNEELKDHPHIKYKVVNRLRNYEWDGKDWGGDKSYNPKLIEHNVYDIEDDD